VGQGLPLHGPPHLPTSSSHLYPPSWVRWTPHLPVLFPPVPSKLGEVTHQPSPHAHTQPEEEERVLGREELHAPPAGLHISYCIDALMGGWQAPVCVCVCWGGLIMCVLCFVYVSVCAPVARCARNAWRVALAQLPAALPAHAPGTHAPGMVEGISFGSYCVFLQPLQPAWPRCCTPLGPEHRTQNPQSTHRTPRTQNPEHRTQKGRGLRGAARPSAPQNIEHRTPRTQNTEPRKPLGWHGPPPAHSPPLCATPAALAAWCGSGGCCNPQQHLTHKAPLAFLWPTTVLAMSRH